MILHPLFYTHKQKPGRLLRPGSFHYACSIQVMHSYTTVVYVCYPLYCLQAQYCCAYAHANSVQTMIAVYSELKS